MATAQTRATDKYRKKMGIISKNFKLKKELADQFADACKKVGVSQTAQIAQMMQEFIESQNK